MDLYVHFLIVASILTLAMDFKKQEQQNIVQKRNFLVLSSLKLFRIPLTLATKFYMDINKVKDLSISSFIP